MDSVSLGIFICLQIFILPFYLIAWQGMRVENERRERAFRASLKALGIIALTRGRRE